MQHLKLEPHNAYKKLLITDSEQELFKWIATDSVFTHNFMKVTPQVSIFHIEI